MDKPVSRSRVGLLGVEHLPLRHATLWRVVSLAGRGTLAQTGLFVGAASVEPYLWSLNDLTIVGTWCYWVHDFDRIASQIARGSLPVERVVTSEVTLDGAPDAFARLASGMADEIKVLIDQ